MTTIEMITVAVGSIGGTMGGWFIGRRKQNAEATGEELKNVQQAITIWRNTAIDLQKQLVNLQQEMQEMRTENNLLRDKIDHLEKTLSKI